MNKDYVQYGALLAWIVVAPPSISTGYDQAPSMNCKFTAPQQNLKVTRTSHNIYYELKSRSLAVSCRINSIELAA